MLDGVGDVGQRFVEIVDLDLAALDAGEYRGQSIGQAAQAWIGRHRADQRLSLGQLVGCLADFLGRQEQQAVALEEFAAGNVLDREEALIPVQALFQRVSGKFGVFGGRCVHHCDDDVVASREGLVVADLALPPIEVWSDHLADVGIDGEVARSVGASQDGQHEADQDGRFRKSDTRSDQLNDKSLEHVLSCSGRALRGASEPAPRRDRVNARDCPEGWALARCGRCPADVPETFGAPQSHRWSPDAMQKFRPSNPSQIVTELGGAP